MKINTLVPSAKKDQCDDSHEESQIGQFIYLRYGLQFTVSVFINSRLWRDFTALGAVRYRGTDTPTRTCNTTWRVTGMEIFGQICTPVVPGNIHRLAASEDKIYLFIDHRLQTRICRPILHGISRETDTAIDTRERPNHLKRRWFPLNLLTTPASINTQMIPRRKYPAILLPPHV